MRLEEIAAERERFENSVYASTMLNAACNEHGMYVSDQVNHAWMGYRWRAAIARAEQAELTAEIERLRERVRELEDRESPEVKRQRQVSEFLWGIHDNG